MLRLGFPLLGRGGWTGGLVYLKNTLKVINSRLASQVEPLVFLSPEEDEQYGPELRPLVHDRVIVDPSISAAGRGRGLLTAIATGRDASFEHVALAAGLDLVFENASFYGASFAIPAISWIPDFQHRHMPEMFSRHNWWRRDIGFRMQIWAGRTLMVSSETAQHDLERFYPRAKGRGHVVHFAIDLDPEPYLARGAKVRAAYGLPEKFLFLPNQFWRHKNHSLVVEALNLIRAAGLLSKTPPVILTGQPNDPRNPSHFDDTMRRAKELGVESHFRYLGLVPYDHVLTLNAACEALINPSRFEGWSTPIEEAKAFATPLILSDIPIHREQCPDALFFDWRSPKTLAEALMTVASRPSAMRPPVRDLRMEQEKRLNAHASALLDVIRAADASPGKKMGRR